MSECIFCFDADNGSILIPLPCECKFGSVHEKCLDKWRLTSVENEKTCTVCKTPYKIAVSFRIRVGRVTNFLSTMLAVFCVIASICIFIYCLMSESSAECRCIRQMEYILYTNVFAYVLRRREHSRRFFLVATGALLICLSIVFMYECNGFLALFFSCVLSISVVITPASGNTDDNSETPLMSSITA